MSETDGSVPEHGGTLTLRLRDSGAVSVSYDTELAAHGSVWRGEVRITIATGNVELDAMRASGAPPWLCDDLYALLRVQWRNRGQGWSRRLTRWREEPAEPEDSQT